MYIKESSLSLDSSHHLESESTRQILLGRGNDETAASFEKRLDEALLANEPPMQFLTIAPADDQVINSAASKLHKLLDMLLDFYSPVGSVVELNTSSRPTLRSLPAFAVTRTRETESCSFSASGNICLADGGTRDFNVDYAMERSEETTQVAAGGQLHDPLVLDFGAPSSTLGAQSVEFDLDADGQTETMRMPGADAAILFHDINRNGKADDGSELFGPQSGNGFSDLAKLDSDGNHWIDAGDAAYADLMLWRNGADNASEYVSLAAAGIGALSTTYADTPFSIKENGEVVGQVRGSSVWLGETEGAGVVRQIDLATTKSGAAKDKEKA